MKRRVLIQRYDSVGRPVVRIDGIYTKGSYLFEISRQEAAVLMGLTDRFIFLNKGYVLIREEGIAIYLHDFNLWIVRLSKEELAEIQVPDEEWEEIPEWNSNPQEEENV